MKYFSEDLVGQVLDELGLQLQQQLPELPGPSQTKGHGGQKVSGFVVENDFDDDLQTRLDNLRRD